MSAAPEVDRLNVHQRRALARNLCGRVAADMEHGKGFKYVSIGHLSNELRPVLAEAGLDYSISVDTERATMTFDWFCVDNPSDTCSDSFPLLPEGADKAWAYQVKWSLIRIFMVSDATEPDEADAAESSGRRTSWRGRAKASSDGTRAGVSRETAASKAKPATATSTRALTGNAARVSEIVRLAEGIEDGAELVGIARRSGTLAAVRVSAGVTRLEPEALRAMSEDKLIALEAQLTDAVVPF